MDFHRKPVSAKFYREGIYQQFLNATYETDHDVRVHIERIKHLAKEFTDAGCPTEEVSTINRILTTLPDSFLGFHTSWESTAIAERTLTNLTTRLCSEEERNQRRNNVGNKNSDKKAFFGQQSFQSSSQYPHQSTSRVDSTPFNRESARFHSNPYPQRGGRGTRRGFRGNRGSDNRDSRFSSSNQGIKRREGKCWHSNYYGHWEKECRFKKDEEAQAHAASLEETSDKAIHLDSDKANVAFVALTANSYPPNH